MEWLLEIVLVLLLAITLFHALRLERALGVLQRDRGALEQLIERFNSSTHQAEQGVEQLRATAEGAGRQIARQMETGAKLKDDLMFLQERGETLADRLDGLVRAARPLAPEPRRPDWVPREARALQEAAAPEVLATRFPGPSPGRKPRHEWKQRVSRHRHPTLRVLRPLLGTELPPRIRSQAERDLLNALRAVR